MATTIELDEKVAATLQAQADLLRLSLPEFLSQIAANASPINQPETLTDASQGSVNENSQLSEEEWNRAIDEVSGNFPVLPDGFNRADIYFDHD